MQQVGQLIQKRIMAADGDYRVFQIFQGTQKADGNLLACLAAFASLRNFQHAVSLHKGRHNAAAPVQRRSNQPAIDPPDLHAEKFLIFQAGDYIAG